MHAKVIWTSSAAIVGSANASSNGLPQEEEKVKDGLIEAGVYVDDKKAIEAIRNWFDKKYTNKETRDISKKDLEEARKARLRPPTVGGVPELVDLPLEKLKQLDLGLFLYSADATDEANEKVEKLETPYLTAENVDWYFDSLEHAQQYPSGRFLVFKTALNRKRLYKKWYFQSFPRQTDWHTITTEDEWNHVIWAFDVYIYFINAANEWHR